MNDNPSNRFAGKVLLATGGGSGIAAATARRYVAEGGRAALLDRDLGRAQAVAAELPGTIALGVDVADEASVEAAIATASEQLGPIDHVLNAAGHAQFGPIEQWTLDDWNRMLAAHLTGTFLVCRTLAPALMERGGAIVNIASTAALMANRHNAPYGAAKGAIVAFSRQLARDLAPTVRVNVVAPGRTRTAMTEPLLAARGNNDPVAGAKVFADGTLLKRLADASEIAAPILFLLSDDASFITGTTLVADGGETAI